MFDVNRSSKVTATHLKKHNETLILREIYAHKAISRVKLAQLTHLSRPSVTELTQGLINKGLIAEAGPEKVINRVGKRPTLLTFNPDAYQIVSVVVGDTTVVASLLDLRVQVINQQSRPMNGATSDQIVDLIIDLIDCIMLEATRPILGISVGTPGILDSVRGIVHLAVNLGWKNLPLAEILSKRFHLPVYLANDSNLAAVGEYRFGLAKGIEDLIVVKIGSGIGAGLLSSGRVIHGSANRAGELGHIPFPPLNDLCICGQHGCLETMVSWWGLRQHAQRLAAAHPESQLNHLVDNGEVTVPVFIEALRLGDPWAEALVIDAATYLGRALVIMINLLNPQKIFLTGSMLQLGDIFVNQVRRTVEDRALADLLGQTEIVANEQDENIIALGASAFLLEKELGI